MPDLMTPQPELARVLEQWNTEEKLTARIAELEAALDVAARRFEWLAARSDEMVNGVRPSVGAAECWAAIGKR